MQSKIWKMENEFYEFAAEHFMMLKDEYLDDRIEKKTGDRVKLYQYLKIRPKAD